MHKAEIYFSLWNIQISMRRQKYSLISGRNIHALEAASSLSNPIVIDCNYSLAMYFMLLCFIEKSHKEAKGQSHVGGGNPDRPYVTRLMSL